MSITFFMKPIKTKLISTKKLRSKISGAMDNERRELVKLMRMTVESWNNPPNITGNVIRSGGPTRIFVRPTPQGSLGAKKWMWLNEGTSVRYADLSPDWSSKTRPGSLASGSGSGTVLRRGRDAKRHPGIAARGWSKIIIDMRKDAFRAAIDRAIREGLL